MSDTDETSAPQEPAEEALQDDGTGDAEAATDESTDDPAAAEETTDESAEDTGKVEAATDEPAEEASDSEAATDEPADPPAHTFDELHGMTVANLRDIVKGLPDDEVLHGYSTMHKEDLVLALCKALGIEDHLHHDVVGIDKGAINTRIKRIKKSRDAALEAHDSKALRRARRRIRSLKRKIRKATT